MLESHTYKVVGPAKITIFSYIYPLLYLALFITWSALMTLLLEHSNLLKVENHYIYLSESFISFWASIMSDSRLL